MATIISASARIVDLSAIDAMISVLPNPAAVRAAIQPEMRYFERIWQRGIGEDHWLTCDGERLWPFKIGGLSVEQAAHVRRLWDDLRREYPELHLDQDALVDIVEGAIGCKVQVS